uniref:Aprataxin and PNKP like factor n=1 Tax=Leptobrachium leishanense TaxID=445787 RepID=A0A8C5MDF8_9ANUR
MSAFQLEDTEGSARTPLPQGESLIGRGPFLGISDKRVSRNHAVLDVAENKLRIKPVHVNPCFYQAKGKGALVPLERDEWHWLHSNDCVSLLPDKYIFRVIEEERRLGNEDVSENSTGNNLSASSPSEVDEKPSCSVTDTSKEALSHANRGLHPAAEEELPLKPTAAAECKGKGAAQRKRVLPDWMLQGDLEVQSLPSPVKKPGVKRKAGAQRKATTSSNEGTSPGRKPTSTRDVEGSEPASTKKKRTEPEVSSTASHEGLQGNVCLENQSDAHVKSHLSDESDMDVQDENLEAKREGYRKNGNAGHGSRSPFKHSRAIDDDERSPSPVEDDSYGESSSHGVSKKRTSCMYGKNCYRKNPAHFQEFSHPGDDDYGDEENGSQDDRPECPFGTDCYRKNPQHKLEYKHTKPPGRRLRKRATKKGKSVLDNDSDNDGEPNEYDLEDSFLDDEEDFDNTEEDSDWMPDSEEKGSEDVDLLVKEAKKKRVP